jgi:mRNA interferase MazF
VARYAYFPDRGDFVHLNFSPAAEHELADRHYGLVLSTSSFAKKTGFALICPITSNTKPWPFDVLVPRGILPAKGGRQIDSVVMTDQVKSVDFRDRACEFVVKAPDDILDEALAKVRAILDSDDVVTELSSD